MSRTFNTRPSKIRFPNTWDRDLISVEYVAQRLDWYTKEITECVSHAYIKLPTTIPKKKRRVDTEWHWTQSTPSWWNNLFHTRPVRGNFRKFTKDIVKSKILDIAELQEPSDSTKPHKYYW